MPTIKQGIVYDVKQNVDTESFRKTEALIKKGDALLAKADADAIKRLEAQKRATEAATRAQQNYQTALSSITSQSAKNMLLGQRISMLGGTILAPFLLSLKSFVSNAGEGDAVANRWKNSMESLASSSQDVGRVVANELNPALEKTAELVADAVNALEKNPELAGSILRIGGGLTAGGAAFSGLSMLSQTFANSGSLRGAQAANKLASVTLVATAVYLGAEAGFAIGNAINRALGRDEQTTDQVATAGKQFLSLVGPIAGLSYALKAVGADEAAAKVADFNLAVYGLGEAAEKTESKIVVAKNFISQYAKEAQEGAKKTAFVAERAKIQTERQSVATEKLTQLKKQEASALADFNKANSAALRQRAADEAAARQQANQDEQRAKRSHENALKKIRADGERAETDAIRSRDALALVEAQQNTKDQIGEENERYAEEKRNLRENLNTRLREIARNFEAERQRRLEEFKYAQQIRALEIQAAQAMVNKIASILASIYKPGTGYNQPVYGSSKSAADVAQLVTPQAVNSGARAEINVSGGGVSVSDVRKIVSASMRDTMGGLERAFGRL